MTDKTPRDRPYNVLFLCTGNSARSIMAEAIMNRFGAPKFHAVSAGSHPKGAVHPGTLKLLSALTYKTDGFRSKSWEEFARPDAPVLDFVFTVCDDAAAEVCPVWPGQPISAHWGVPDPARATGSDATIAYAFDEAYRQLQNRITIFCSLPIAALDRITLQKRAEEIGKTAAPPVRAG